MLFGRFIWVPGCKREWLEITTVHLDINTQKTAKTARLAADRLCWARFRTCNIVYRSKFSRLNTAGSVFPFNVSHAIIGFSLPIILDHLTSPALFAAWALMAFDDPNWCKRSRVIFMAWVSRRPELPQLSSRPWNSYQDTLNNAERMKGEKKQVKTDSVMSAMWERERVGEGEGESEQMKEKESTKGTLRLPMCVCLCVYVFREEQRRKLQAKAELPL